MPRVFSLAFALCALLAVPVLAPAASASPPPTASGSFCTGGDAGAPLACAGAKVWAAVSCRTDAAAGTYSCRIAVRYEGSASIAAPAVGSLAMPVYVRVGVCNGPGACQEDVLPAAASCSWGPLKNGCTAGGRTAAHRSGTLVDGCLDVWVQVIADAHARAGTAAVSNRAAADLASASVPAWVESDTCA